MAHNPKEPLYISLPLSVWQNAQRIGDISGLTEFTDSMRIAEDDACTHAQDDLLQKGVILKLDAERLMADHGEPTELEQSENHHEHEHSFSYFKNRIERLTYYVVGIIECGIRKIENIFEGDGNYD